MKYQYTEEGYENMVEAAIRGRRTQLELAEEVKLEYLRNPKICPHCEQVIPYHKKAENTYCSQSCAGSHSQKGRKRKPAIKFNCAQCGVEVTGKGKFCGSICSAKFRAFNIEGWLQGEVSGNTATGCSSAIKRYLLDQCNHQCPKCGWGEINLVTGHTPLEINHIDGNYKNNKPLNLEVLCPNCHSLTPTFKNLNRGNGRSSRTEGLQQFG